MKKVVLFILFNFSIIAQTTLNPGDIAFIGFYSDGLSGSGGDGFTFILLNNLDATTVIYFTDDGWNGNINSWYASPSDGHLSWTVPSGGLSAGTIVYITETTTDDVLSASVGSVALLSGIWHLPSSGDQVLAYQSSSGPSPASPTFIAAEDADYFSSYDGSDGWTTSYDVNTESYASYLPPGLTNGVNCVALANSAQPSEYDNFKYTGTLTGTAAAVRTAINTYSNWANNNDGSMDISSGYSSPNITLPVELISFEAEVTNNEITLNWQTATEVNNYGFEIERCETQDVRSETWEKIGFVQGNGTTNSPKEYSFTDTDLPDANEVSYRLKQIDNDGTFEYSKTVTVDLSNITSVEDELNYEFALEQNYPNPFNPTTTIKYQVASIENVKLIVYNSLGQQVAILVNEQKPAGKYEVEFDGSNLSSGMYLYKIQAGDFIAAKKFILMK